MKYWNHKPFADSTSALALVEELYLPGCIKIVPIPNNYQFQFTWTNFHTLYIPNCVDIGDFVTAETSSSPAGIVRNNFSATSLDITVPSYLQTCNSGGVEGDLAYMLSNSMINSITYV